MPEHRSGVRAKEVVKNEQKEPVGILMLFKIPERKVDIFSNQCCEIPEGKNSFLERHETETVPQSSEKCSEFFLLRHKRSF